MVVHGLILWRHLLSWDPLRWLACAMFTKSQLGLLLRISNNVFFKNHTHSSQVLSGLPLALYFIQLDDCVFWCFVFKHIDFNFCCPTLLVFAAFTGVWLQTLDFTADLLESHHQRNWLFLSQEIEMLIAPGRGWSLWSNVNLLMCSYV